MIDVDRLREAYEFLQKELLSEFDRADRIELLQRALGSEYAAEREEIRRRNAEDGVED